MRSKVDLPQPLGPTRHRNSPGVIFRLMSSSASTRPAPLTYSLRTPAISIAAPRRWTIILLSPDTSPAAGQFAVLVLQDEGPERLIGFLDIARCYQPLGGEVLQR